MFLSNEPSSICVFLIIMELYENKRLLGANQDLLNSKLYEVRRPEFYLEEHLKQFCDGLALEATESRARQYCAVPCFIHVA